MCRIQRIYLGAGLCSFPQEICIVVCKKGAIFVELHSLHLDLLFNSVFATVQNK